MAGRYRLNREKNLSRFYILLSVIFIFVMFKWGVPVFVNVIAGKGAVRQTQEKDVIPPQTPVLSALPEATNSADLSVDGYTEAGATLDLLINDNISVTGKAGDDGSFSLTGTLLKGSNRIYVRAADAAGNMSSSEVKMVNFDNKPLDLVISSPKDGTEAFGKNNQVIDIVGQVSKPSADVVINGSFAAVDSDGHFTYRFQLSDGNNDLKIVASDAAGNTATQTLKLVYTP